MLPALVVAVWLAGSASPAPSVELRWDAPAGCPTQDVLERQIAGMLMERPAPVNPPRVAFRVEQRGDRWHLVGEISGTANSGHRELSAATCAELADAAVLITAIAIDPDLPPEDGTIAPPGLPPGLPPPTVTPVVPPPITAPVVPPPITAPDGPPSIADAAPPEPAPEPAPEPLARPARPRPSALLGIAAGLGLGALSAPAGLLRLALGLRGDRWSVALTQDFWLPRTIDAPQSPGLGGRFWLWSTGLRGCVILRARRIEAPMCATVAAGIMSGQGIGDLTPAGKQQRSPWVAVSAGPGLRVPLGRRLGLLFSAELLAIVARPRFEITGRPLVCCGNTLGGQFTGGLEFRLP